MRRALAAVTGVALLATGCGSAAGSEQAGGPVRIIVWDGQSDAAAKSIAKLVAQFNQAHPDIKVSLESGAATADGMLTRPVTD
jgi:multiple sugar transport system substrate-binding protein